MSGHGIPARHLPTGVIGRVQDSMLIGDVFYHYFQSDWNTDGVTVSGWMHPRQVEILDGIPVPVQRHNA